MKSADVLLPDWPAPNNIECLVTKCRGGEFNLASHVGDLDGKVLLNRETLQKELGLESSVQWLNQVHGSDVYCLDGLTKNSVPNADALFTQEENQACAVLTADCLPVFFCDQAGKEVAVAHAGWRGLMGGVLENTIHCFSAAPDALMAWLGPAIGPCHFEVGQEVRKAFIDIASIRNQKATAAAFTPAKQSGKLMGDLYQLAKLRLSYAGLSQVYGGGHCTYCEHQEFFSYRHNNSTGRFASVIWRKV